MARPRAHRCRLGPRDAGSLGQVLFAFVSTFSLILLPTTMMGATLPLLIKHVVHRNDQLGWQVALLYAINTAGAVLGTLSAAFLCLPTLGLSKTVWVGVAANLLVFGLVWLMARQTKVEREPGEGNRSDEVRKRKAPKRRGKRSKVNPLTPNLSPRRPRRGEGGRLR